MNFEVADLVLSHLRKERFRKREYHKLKLKKNGPCRILRKFSVNVYEIEFEKYVGICPIFNVAYMYPFHVGESSQAEDDIDNEQQIHWRK